MEEMDYWRLCDELNVVQAALLIVGQNPINAEYVENCVVLDRYMGYEAAKTALTHALRSYDRYILEVESFQKAPLGWSGDTEDDPLEPVRPHALRGRYVPLYDTDINGNPCDAIEGSIHLLQSTVEVAALKEWLKERGFHSGFFFPISGDTPDYLDPRNPRYAPKLAAAVRAWQAVTDPGRKSPKQALEKWIRENAVEFGLADDDGLPMNQAVEDCSKVANWQRGGGVPKTPS